MCPVLGGDGQAPPLCPFAGGVSRVSGVGDVADGALALALILILGYQGHGTAPGGGMWGDVPHPGRGAATGLWGACAGVPTRASRSYVTTVQVTVRSRIGDHGQSG